MSNLYLAIGPTPASACEAIGASVSGGSIGGSTASTTPVFTGTSPTTALNSTAALQGTGYTTSGQTVTTTDTHTVTLNQYVGCWLLTATHAPCFIVGHPAATGAPVAFFVIGAAPPTTAEQYHVMVAPTPTGTVSAHNHAAGTLTTP